ncbi:MAG: hypothetical protein ABI647_13470 [Gemmatimonadota bacterium]
MRRSYSIAVFTVISLLLGQWGELFAQDVTSLTSGDSLRIRARSFALHPTKVIFRGVSASDLTISDVGSTVERRVPLADIVGLERTNGTKRRTWTGVGAGYLVGATFGSVVGGTAGPTEATEKRSQRAATLGMGAGVAVGAVVGSLLRTTRWERLSITAIRPDLLAGMEVRARGADPARLTERVRGIIQEVTADSLVLLPRAGGSPLRVARARVSVEWPFGQKRATLKGMGIGALIGVIGGGAAGLAAGGDDCSTSGWFSLCFSQGESAAIGAFVFGVLGTSVGGIAGFATRTTQWEGGAYAPRVAVTPLITPRSVGIRGSVRF